MNTKKDLGNGWWNYRFLLKNVIDNCGNLLGDYYELVEVYYSENGDIIAWSDDLGNVTVESLQDYKNFIKQMNLASKETVLTVKNRKLIDTKEYMRKK